MCGGTVSRSVRAGIVQGLSPRVRGNSAARIALTDGPLASDFRKRKVCVTPNPPFGLPHDARSIPA